MKCKDRFDCVNFLFFDCCGYDCYTDNYGNVYDYKVNNDDK